MSTALCAGFASQAHAFSQPVVFAAAESAGGGGGRWFTGSPADGYGCGTCHTSYAGQRTYPLYVTGAPGRYTRQAQYEIFLNWPEFAEVWTLLRPDATATPVAGAQLPSIGLIAELVPQSGRGAGVIEIDSDFARIEEQCQSLGENIRAQLGAQLYQVRSGIPPVAVRPDENGILRCESRQLAQRCVIALKACGARQIRFRWTAPEQNEGTVWLSAGFVASEALGGDTVGDSVYEVTVPIIEQSSPSGFYEEKLENASCAVARPGAATGSSAFTVGAVAALLLCLRRWRST